MNEIKVYNIPEKQDVLTKQYFSNVIEIRANMTRLTGSGKLIASIELLGDIDADKSNMEKIEMLFEIVKRGLWSLDSNNTGKRTNWLQ